jgi:phosphohistidine phosphatase
LTLRLILTRHAKSDWSTPGEADYDRPLNARGRRQAPLVGRWLASRRDLPAKILCSDAVRTRETLDLILPELPVTPEVDIDPALYHAAPDAILSAIRAQHVPVLMVVGHNPGLAEAAQRFAHSAPLHPRFGDFPTAATAVFDFTEDAWSMTSWGRGTLRDFVTPDDLSA